MDCYHLTIPAFPFLFFTMQLVTSCAKYKMCHVAHCGGNARFQQGAYQCWHKVTRECPVFKACCLVLKVHLCQSNLQLVTSKVEPDKFHLHVYTLNGASIRGYSSWQKICGVVSTTGFATKARFSNGHCLGWRAHGTSCFIRFDTPGN